MKRFILPLLWGILSGLLFMGSTGFAKEKPSLSASRMTLKAGDSAFIVLQENPNNLVSWSVTSGKKCISLDSAVNYGEQIITAKKPGTAKLVARVGSSRYRCTIRIKKAKGAKSIVLTASQIKKAGIRTSGTVKIPGSFRYKKKTYKITAIAPDCFGKKTKMRKLVISKNIRLIGSGAFNNCTGLRQVTLPGRLRYLGTATFYKCSSLTTVKLPGSMRSIGLNLFDSCKSLTQVSFADGIRSLPTSTFNHCQNLRTVKLPSTLTYIGKKAFYECASLTQITIPDSVTSIHPQFFSGSDTNFVDGKTTFLWRGQTYTNCAALLQAMPK